MTRDPGRIAFGVSATAVAVSGLYDFTWSFRPMVLLGALGALQKVVGAPDLGKKPEGQLGLPEGGLNAALLHWERQAYSL